MLTLFSVLSILVCNVFLVAIYHSDMYMIQEIEGPEAALTKLFASAKSTGYGLNRFGVDTKCLQSVPFESQLHVDSLLQF